MKPIEIDGKLYKVVENLPYQNVGYRSKVVVDENEKERVAVFNFGKWRFWTAEDRLGIRR